MYLLLDTETTGVTPRDRIVSICYAFYDSRGEKTSSMYTLIRPDGFTIPPEATAIHGITAEEALRKGHNLVSTLESLSAEIGKRRPEVLVGHNVSFDHAMILREYVRIQRPEPISRLRTFCTMKGTADICRIPGRFGQYKWPTLDELHRHVFGSPFKGAHNAQADVEACARCFFELKRQGLRLG